MDIQALELVYGYPVPLASGATEPVEVIDLMGGVIQLAVEGAVSGWTPAYAALKNSGIWNDSPLLDGRQLTAAASGNVTESLSCVATGTHAARASAIARLMRFAQAARDFHTEDAAYRPVYIRYWATGASADQYALVYNIEVDVQQDPFGAADSNLVTLTIEREPFWRAIKPLDDPRQYTKQVTGTLDHLVTATVSNFYENSAPISLLRLNYVDIPATLIKGDAPSKCFVSITAPAKVKRTWVTRVTQPNRFDNPRNTVKAVNCTLRSGGAASQVAASNGLVTDGGDATRRVLRFTLGATYTTSEDVITNITTLLKKRSLVFVRGKLNSGSYSTLKTEVHIKWIDGSVAKLPFVLGTNFTTAYAGIIDAPPTRQMILFDNAERHLMGLEFYASTTGGAATFDLWDVVFIPFDEYALSLGEWPNGNTASIDNTGYLSGRYGDAFIARRTTVPFNYAPLEARGQMLELEPNQDNRLYFMFEMDSTTAAPTQDFTVNVNIVPRWHGVRDG